MSYNGEVLHHDYKEVCMKKAFTLAEMMVVMLILSIVLAAMAPVMTTRNKTDQSSPWRYSEGNLSDAYYGLGESQTAMIGQREFETTDEAAKLIINSSGTRPVSIAFKKNGENLAKLFIRKDADDKTFVLGDASTENTNNTVIGSGTFSEGSGNYNTILGSDAMSKTTKSSYNVAIGTTALSEAYGTDGNIAIGFNTLKSIRGLNRGLSYWPGNGSVAIGYESQASIGDMTGHRGNTSIGFQSLKTCTSCGGNTGTGWGALRLITQGDGNSAFGSNAMASITTGDSNTALGECAMTFYSSGTGNTAVGNTAMAPSARGDYNTALGYNAMAEFRTTGNGNTALGAFTNVQGENSIAIGGGIAKEDASVANGQQALAIGYKASTKTDYGIAIGNSSSSTNTDAIAIGSRGVTASGESSIAIGSKADDATTTASGSGSIAIGDGAVSTGDWSIALGVMSEAKGNSNVAIGTNACKGVTGTNKTCIGANSGPSDPVQKADTSTESIYFGTAGHFKRPDGRYDADVNSVMELHKRGDYALAVVNADFVIRGDLITMPRKKSGGRDARYGAFRTKYIDNAIEFDNVGDPSSNFFSSDKRLKYVGKEFTSGLDKIRELQVFNYTYKKDKNKTPHVGVIAQDLQKIFPDAVIKGKNGFLKIRMEDMFYAVINAIKELDARVTAQDKRIQELENIVKQQDARLKLLETKLK